MPLYACAYAKIRSDGAPRAARQVYPALEQRTEGRGQRSEVRGQRSEIRDQRAEVRDQRSEVRGPPGRHAERQAPKSSDNNWPEVAPLHAGRLTFSWPRVYRTGRHIAASTFPKPA